MPSTIINVSTLDELNGAIAFVDGQTSGSYTIHLAADITEGTSALVGSSGNLQNPDGSAAMSNGQPVPARNDLYALNLAVGVDVTIDGDGHTLDGASTYRGLFVYAGHVAIQDLTIAHASAKGGSGGDGFSGGGGGGAGLGGGLFIGSNVAGNAGAVTLSNVSFQSNAAVGGASGITDTSGLHSFTGGGGGGGMGGSGAAGDAGADGGGISESAGTTTGFVLGATLGGGSGLDGGGEGNGGAGGFGGGGGGSFNGGGDGGFGGAGGGGGSFGGNGGFGGGGGSNLYDFGATGHGGFGAGDGGTAGGGAGLGAGGDIFIQHGASLTIAEGTFDDASVSADSPSPRRTASAYGSGLFIMGDATVTLGAGQTAGQTLTINDDIADQNGAYASNHGGALPTGTSADGSPNTGVGSLILAGAGKILFGGVNTYTGTTTVQSGTFELEGSVANSAVTIQNGATLDGRNGTTGALQVDSGGHVNPGLGNDTGALHTGDLSFASGSSFTAAWDNSFPYDPSIFHGYTYIGVTGTVSLGGATLNLVAFDDFAPSPGETYKIIDNDGSDAVIGTFAGLAEGATLVFGGQTLTISYHGGDGNDVVLSYPSSAEAPSLIVTTLADVVDANDNETSLREAIAYANSHANADANTPDIISFASGLNGTIRLTGGTLVVTDALKIDGDLDQNGKPKITISGDANGDDTHIAGSTVITNIAASQTAGTLSDNVQLIRTSANLTLDSLVFTGGTATGADIEDARGGAVGAFNTADPGTAVSVTATATTFAGNSAVSAGGAISASGTVTLDSATVSGNVSGAALSSAGGGGIFASTVSLTNTTLSGNDAVGRGGGAFGVFVAIVNSTVSGNHSTNEGGGLAASVNVNATNSIISGNDADSGNDNSTTPLLFHGLNVYGGWLYDDSGFVANTSIGAIFASVTTNPYTGIMSGTLADNGGPVATIALKADPTNPALDSANNSAPSDDARDLARHDYSGIANAYGTAGADLGAFELQDNFAAIAKNDGINILGATVAYNPVISATTQAVIADPGSEFQDGDLVSNLSGTQLVLSSANDFGITHDYSYTLPGGNFVFTSVSVIDDGEYGIDASVVNGALVVHNPAIYPGEDVILGLTVGLKESGAFSGNLFADNGNGADNDPDGDTFAVTKINGASVTDGQVITLPSGARLTIQTDGAFSYDTNHAFDSLNDGQTATESFTYAITGGGTATTSFTIVGEGNVDTTPPTITINTIAGDDVVNAAEGAGTITVSGTATGAENGQVVTLALKTANGVTTLQTMTAVVAAGLWHIDLPPGATPAFPDGPYLVAANVSDAAGNPATEATHTITVDTHAPTITINTIAGDDVVNAAEGAGVITISGTAAGAEDGQVVTLALKTANGSATLQTMTTTVSGGAWHLDLPPGATPAFPDGPYLVTADVSDAAGNPATEATRAITVDTAVPATTSLFHQTGTGHPGPHGGAYATPGVSDGFVVVATGDFNHDGTTDVLWRDAAGRVDEWSMHNETWATSIFLGSHGADWQVAGTGDFNGDGTDDILWRNPNTGQLDAWIMQNGQWSRSVDLGSHGTDWKVIGIGDFNGDHTDDILFQNTTTGAVDEWRMANGNWSDSTSLGSHSPAYSQVAIGDLDGDGTSDVLWRNPTTGAAEEWHMQNGNWGRSIDLGGYATSYELAGVNDFNGDGTADVLWRNPTTGAVDGWVMDHGQWFASVSLGSFDPAYRLAGTGDFNHVGGDDIFWHNATTGQTATWLLGPA